MQFQGGPAEIAAMASGDIDISQIGHGAHALCIEGEAKIFGLDLYGKSDEVLANKNNVARATGWAALYYHEELQDKKVFTVFTFRGISGCLIDHGKIQSSRNSLIGEIGHMIICPEIKEFLYNQAYFPQTSDWVFLYEEIEVWKLAEVGLAAAMADELLQNL